MNFIENWPWQGEIGKQGILKNELITLIMMVEAQIQSTLFDDMMSFYIHHRRLHETQFVT